MSTHRRIDRRARRVDAPMVTTVGRGDVGEFLSESAADADFAPGSASSRRADRPPDEEPILIDDEGFKSEAAACAGDGSTKPSDAPTSPGLFVFLSEDHPPAPSNELSGRDEALDVDAPLPETAIVVSRVHARRWLSTSMTLIALSASFFVGVVLVTEVLDRMNRASFTSVGPSGSDVGSDAAPVALVTAPLAARPSVVATRPARYPSVVEPRVASFGPVPAPPSPAASLSAVRAPATERAPRQIEPVLLEASPVAPEAAPVVLATAPSRPSLGAPPVAPPPAAAPSAAAAVAAPTGAEAPVAPPPPRVPTEADQIGGVLTRYRGAFNALDPAAARGVWPSVDERALGRAFAGLAEQEVNFAQCAIEVAGVRAAAHCIGNARYVPKIGSRTPQTTTRQWRFDLQKIDDRWVIEAVEVR